MVHPVWRDCPGQTLNRELILERPPPSPARPPGPCVLHCTRVSNDCTSDWGRFRFEPRRVDRVAVAVSKYDVCGPQGCLNKVGDEMDLLHVVKLPLLCYEVLIRVSRQDSALDMHHSLPHRRGESRRTGEVSIQLESFCQTLVTDPPRLQLLCMQKCPAGHRFCITFAPAMRKGHSNARQWEGAGTRPKCVACLSSN